MCKDFLAKFRNFIRNKIKLNFSTVAVKDKCRKKEKPQNHNLKRIKYPPIKSASDYWQLSIRHIHSFGSDSLETFTLVTSGANLTSKC